MFAAAEMEDMKEESTVDKTKAEEQEAKTTSVLAPAPLFPSVAYSIDLYPITQYSFGKKAPFPVKDLTVEDRLNRMRRNYKKCGMRRTVEGILLLQNHGFPHLLLLQLGPKFFTLPGGRLRPGESEEAGLKRKLASKLDPDDESHHNDYEIGEVMSTWWRPTFESPLFPYIPPHVSKPKECKKIYIVQLDESGRFAVAQNTNLVAVPLFELYTDVKRFGPILSTLPIALARYNLHINR
eukprot:g75794.t1